MPAPAPQGCGDDQPGTWETLISSGTRREFFEPVQPGEQASGKVPVHVKKTTHLRRTFIPLRRLPRSQHQSGMTFRRRQDHVEH
jgi:hypothetical protein